MELVGIAIILLLLGFMAGMMFTAIYYIKQIRVIKDDNESNS